MRLHLFTSRVAASSLTVVTETEVTLRSFDSCCWVIHASEPCPSLGRLSVLFSSRQGEVRANDGRSWGDGPFCTRCHAPWSPNMTSSRRLFCEELRRTWEAECRFSLCYVSVMLNRSAMQYWEGLKDLFMQIRPVGEGCFYFFNFKIMVLLFLTQNIHLDEKGSYVLNSSWYAHQPLGRSCTCAKIGLIYLRLISSD